MKQKLLVGFIALFTCLLNVSASNDLDDIIKKYQNYKGEDIAYQKMDLKQELKNAKAGKASEDVDIEELQKYIEIGFRKMEVLVCFRFEKMIDSKVISEVFKSESTSEFMDDFTQLRETMLNNNKLSHVVVNKQNCNVDCFLLISEASTTKEGYLFIKMMNGSINCIIHFHGKLKTDDIIKSIEDGTFIGISGFEPTFTITEE